MGFDCIYFTFNQSVFGLNSIYLATSFRIEKKFRVRLDFSNVLLLLHWKFRVKYLKSKQAQKFKNFKLYFFHSSFNYSWNNQILYFQWLLAYSVLHQNVKMVAELIMKRSRVQLVNAIKVSFKLFSGFLMLENCDKLHWKSL